jgi:hypothetical protein
MLKVFCYRHLGVGVVASALLAGCGLINSDITNFDLTLPEKKFTIDASGWAVKQTDADRFTSMKCTSGSTTNTCNSAIQTVCPMGCSGICNAAQTCDLSLDISLSQSINLVMEKPELKSLNDEPVIKVTIDSVTYEIRSNTLNVDTPELDVLIAPTAVVKSSEATLIAKLAPVPAMQTTGSPDEVVFTDAGKSQLITMMNSFKTPFNVLLGSSIVIKAGDPVPTGKLEAVVNIRGHAGL